MIETTVVITPRDRYTGIIQCIENLYHCTKLPFKLLVLDLAYPKSLVKKMEVLLADKENAELIHMGPIIPMEAHRIIREQIETPYTVLLDNDSDVTEGWLEPLLETAHETGAAIINPLTLEREGVDAGEKLRNHLYTSDIRLAEVEGKPYLIENKHYRRTPVRDLPMKRVQTQTFELHCVMFDTQVLKALELPQATIREHIDISMQVQAMGKQQVVEPRSVIEFDNLGTRALLSDLKYFNLRWNSKITKQSSDLFEKRWGYRFYSEQIMYNWVIRRRLYLILNYFYFPSWLANKIANAVQKFFLPIWDPLEDPIGQSDLFYDTLPDGIPVQINHEFQ